jgi:phosphoribosyl 1,2-cyclic phosphate phosphodiesterase
MADLRITILGCGSSGGVPRLGPDWGACDPANPRNARRRCSVLIERITDAGVTRVLIDTSPDLRAQLLDAAVTRIDAVLYTHAHADHTHGIDDLRMVFHTVRRRIPVWADAETSEALIARFGYAFVQPEGSDYPPICALHLIDGPVTVDGAGGALTLTPVRVNHGNIDALGFLTEGACYLPDVLDIPDAAWPVLADLRLWIVDALRYHPHPSHAHLDRTLGWIARARPLQAVITNMHIDLDHARLMADLPRGVIPAHDGLQLTLPIA